MSAKTLLPDTNHSTEFADRSRTARLFLEEAERLAAIVGSGDAEQAKKELFPEEDWRADHDEVLSFLAKLREKGLDDAESQGEIKAAFGFMLPTNIRDPKKQAVWLVKRYKESKP